MQTAFEVRRLRPADAAVYRALRLEGFAAHPLEFRYAQRGGGAGGRRRPRPRRGL